MQAVEAVRNEAPAPIAKPTTPKERAAAVCALAAPLLDASRPIGAQLESGARSVVRALTNATSLAPGAYAYLFDEVVEECKRVKSVASNELSQARDEIRSIGTQLDMLARIPPPLDVPEVLIDQEIRGAVRAMPDKARAKLFAELNDGRQQRALLALARAPMPNEFETEVAALYATVSDPGRRGALEANRDLAIARKVAASTLVEIAQAAVMVAETFVRARQAYRDA